MDLSKPIDKNRGCLDVSRKIDGITGKTYHSGVVAGGFILTVHASVLSLHSETKMFDQEKPDGNR